jgi:hypothetical protein
VQKSWAKTISLSQTSMFYFSSPNFNIQGHVLSITGDALRNHLINHITHVIDTLALVLIVLVCERNVIEIP